MTSSDSEVVRALFERVGGGDIDFALELISEDCVLDVPPSLSAEPDVYEGHAGARRYMRGFDGLVDDVRYEPLEILEEDGRVIALMRVAGRGATSGIDIALEAAVVCLVHDGKITRLDPYPNLEAAREGRRGIE
jgi:ketosteroid isomerase-like protein